MNNHLAMYIRKICFCSGKTFSIIDDDKRGIVQTMPPIGRD